MDPSTPVRFEYSPAIGADPIVLEAALEAFITPEALLGMTRECVEKVLVAAHAEWILGRWPIFAAEAGPS